MPLSRESIIHDLNRIFKENFEIEDPGPDENLSQAYEFDSIDAIELLVEIEKILGFNLTQEEKKQAVEIRTINQICDYMEGLAEDRA